MLIDTSKIIFSEERTGKCKCGEDYLISDHILFHHSNPEKIRRMDLTQCKCGYTILLNASCFKSKEEIAKIK